MQPFLAAIRVTNISRAQSVKPDAAKGVVPIARASCLQGSRSYRAIEHPLHPELVGELAVVVAPRLHAERRGDGAALGELREQRRSALATIHHEQMGRAPHRLGVMII